MIEKPPLAIQAAKASWLAPLLAIGLGMGTRAMTSGSTNTDPQTTRAIWLIVGALIVLIVVAGLVCGILALFGIKKHGAKGILLPSIIGILLSSGYLYLLIQAVLHVRHLINEAAVQVP